ncbi:MAG: hypothetical protein AAB676_00325 [Verrucomicrobiota bacterium]
MPPERVPGGGRSPLVFGSSKRHGDFTLKRDPFGIAAGGEQRLREAIEAQVRQKHQDELSAATDQSQEAAIEEKIQQEIKERMKQVGSPHSLWSSQ